MPSLPSFPGLCNIWRFTNWTGSFPPDVETLCELVDRRPYVQAVYDGTSFAYVQHVELWFPAGTDVRGSIPSGSSDVVEFPAGSGRLYLAVAVGDHAKLLPNEFRYALARPFIFPWPLP